MRTDRHLRHIWSIPTLLAVVTMVGLLSALLGDQIVWKGIGWVGLIVPVVTASWFALRRRRV